VRRLLHSLDCAPGPVDVYFRDDDAGWEDARLLALCDLFGALELPLDLGVIPNDLTERLGRELSKRRWVALHQHGFTHRNHEREGSKCEFGPSRSYDQQRHDIAAGRDILEALLGDFTMIFTPPWNRCTLDTARAVHDLGFAMLSREHRDEPFGLDGLAELPVHLDFARLAPEALDERFAALVSQGGPVGVMFHHAVMDREAFDRARELLDLLARHEAVRARHMLMRA
jgi:peptidoglycan/xylan/chitin deacetylase (PgdA/CDA1 family)